MMQRQVIIENSVHSSIKRNAQQQTGVIGAQFDIFIPIVDNDRILD
jgi:hypothetical protein